MVNVFSYSYSADYYLFLVIPINNDVFEYSLEFEPNADLSQVAVNVDFNRGRLGAMDGVKLSMSTTL